MAQGNVKNVVCFGGGNAVPKAVLAPLKKYPVNITSVTSMVDSGGSTGQLREDLDVLPPGDIRRHVLALSEAPEWKKKLWNFRFGHDVFSGGHKGHNFANVFIAGLEHSLSDYSKALEIVHEFMEVKGRALPATIDKVQLCAKLENGKTLVGEDKIDISKEERANIKIKEVYLKPRAKAYPPVLDAIAKADIITIGPGDLYTSLVPCLLSEGVSTAMKKTKAKKILICNTMTKLGETDNFSVLDFAKEVEKYIGCALDFVIYNSEMPSKERIAEYKKEESLILEPVRVDGGLDAKKFIGTKILASSIPIIYDPEKLAKLVYSLI